MFEGPTGGVPQVIWPLMPGNLEAISRAVWPPSDQPNTMAPATPSDFRHTQHSQDFDGGIRKSWQHISARRIRRIAGFTMSRQSESNETIILGKSPAHLVAKDTTANRVPVDQKNREISVSGFVDCDRPMRRRESVLPRSIVHL